MVIEFFKNNYKSLVLDHPRIALGFVLLVTLILSAFIPQFRLDASSDSLLLERDESLAYYREIEERYGSDSFLVVTYTPEEDLFNSNVLSDLADLRDELKAYEQVSSVTSILDVPLINSPPVTLQEFQEGIQTLTSSETNKTLARKELTTSPFFSELIISKDGQTTAILATLKEDKRLEEVIDERADLLEKQETEEGLSAEEEDRLEQLEEEHAGLSGAFQERREKTIEDIREIIKPHQEMAEIHLGGVPMIVADSMNFVKKDLQIFGFLILCFIVVLLGLFFHERRWVLLPILNCTVVGIFMFGFLGFTGWPVTVVSSNFISLLLIFTLSFSVHQIVRYREYQADHPDADQETLVRESTLKIIVPCLFMVVTTIAAFGSLVVSDIRPVIDFGWMMSVGLIASFFMSFIILPCSLLFLPVIPLKERRDVTAKITTFFADIIEKYSKPILAAFITVIVFCAIGTSFLTVENRFINYYKESTEIHQGMLLIDQKLGGTMPLDVIVDAPQGFMETYRQKRQAFIAEKKEEDPNYVYNPHPVDGYWTLAPRQEMYDIHNYLDELPETGKVLSFVTSLKLAHDLDPQIANTVVLSALQDEYSQTIEDTFFDAYISPDGNQARFAMRIYESDEDLNRNELIEKIRNHLVKEMGIAPERVHLTGMLVLYNNVLQSLYDSQIKTIWTVFITIFVMFTILFRSPYIAGVAFLPNITITVMVLGIMGWLHIPLDIMTITIAAICTGSADDNTIHYVHRFMTEYKKHGNYWKAVRASHGTIGRAMYYTSITVMLGFSILAFSNFVPTIYFGLLIAFAMLMAMLANLVLLPLLLVLFKPMKKA